MAKKCKKLEEIKAMFNDFEVDLDSINTKELENLITNDHTVHGH